MEKFERIMRLDEARYDSVFLFGARQTGKTTLLQELFPQSPYYDLLDIRIYERLRRNPALLGQELEALADGSLVIIDEIQLLPDLLNEVHRQIVKKGLRFVLSGSSARKLKRRGVNTLGGRAAMSTLYPLTSAEIPGFDINRAINNGLIPRHYLADGNLVEKRLQAYVSVYLREEIRAEALVRNLSSFNRFMEAAALTNGEMVNYNNIAQDCGVDAKTVKEYFNILTDTLVGYMIPAYSNTVKRRVAQSPRFYYFDVAIPNYLLNKRHLQPGSVDYGHSFEHLIMLELTAYIGYKDIRETLSYWHTYTGYEVDAVVGDARVAIEIKSVREVQPKHLKGLKAFEEEHPGCRLMIVSLDAMPRLLNGVEVLPASDFLRRLWQGEIL